MRFTLHVREPSHGIRVIPSIPDLPLGRIEGLNGVGKTLAVHLLEICSGHQPYTTRPHAWRTLCEYLGPVEVLIEGLRSADSADESAHSMRFAFDWRDRKDSSAPGEIGTDLFDEVILDDAPIEDMNVVRRWLRVVRIAGNQNLTDTIAGIVAYDLALVNAAANLAESRARHADIVVSELLQPFPIELAQRALAASEGLAAIRQQRSEFEQERQQLAGKLENLQRAESTLAAVQDISSNSDDLRAEIRSLNDQIAAAHERSQLADQELEVAHEKARLSSEATQQLEAAEELFEKRLKSLKRLERSIETKDLPAVTDLAVVTESLEKNQASRARVAEDQSELQDMFALRDLLDGLIRALAPAASSGLRGRSVATLGSDTITVGSLLDAVRGRRTQLSEDAPAVEELDQRASELEVEKEKLVELRVLLMKRETKRKELRSAEQALEELAPPESDPASVAEKSAARAAAQRIEMELQAALGSAERQLAQLGGGLSIEDLRAELERHLQEAGTTTTQLPEDVELARRNLVAADDRLDTASARRDELASQVQEMGRNLADQTRSFRADDRHSRLRRIVGDHLPAPDLNCEELAQAWLDIHAAGNRTVRRFQSARADLNRLRSLIDDLVNAVEKGGRPAPELDEVRRYYQDRMLAQFSQPELLDALFDSGELTRVDLAAGEIVWRTDNGEPRVRPFEAFSSGERAFAYVQAQLASVEELEAANKLVAIDEFGAFLSRDRLVRLQEAVQRQLATGTVSQALVILPMSREEDIAASGSAGYITGSLEEITAV